MKKVACTALLIGLLVSPALGAVVVSFNPQTTNANVGDVFWVDIVADIPANEPIVGWGFDLDLATPGVAVPTGNVVLGAGWIGVPPGGDGDPYAALSFPSGISGMGVLLAQVQFQAIGLGQTQVVLSDDNPADLTEGFLIEPPPIDTFATVFYNEGTIIVPEPTALVLLALGALLRRR